MRVASLSVKNFRRFEEATWPFAPGVTCLIGENGAGKSTVMDALAIALGYLIEFVGQHEAFDIDDVRRQVITFQKERRAEPQFPATIDAQFEFDGGEQGRVSSMRDPKQADFSVDSPLEDLAAAAREGEGVVLPVLAYYRSDRRRSRRAPAGSNELYDDLSNTPSRLDGYLDWSRPETDEARLRNWMIRRRLIELDEKGSDEVLDAVRDAVRRCVVGARDLSFNIRQGEVQLEFEGGDRVPLHMLSDGYRGTLGVVADIAFRAALLNPQFGGDVLRKTPGVVLIDEIDLHLHPKWQRDVLESLRTTFPEIQFIVTTHSPFIVQSLREGELLKLDATEATPSPTELSLEEIADDIMGVDDSTRSKRYQEMIEAAERYYKLVDQSASADSAELAALKARLDELLAPYSDNPAYVAYLRAYGPPDLDDPEQAGGDESAAGAAE